MYMDSALSTAFHAVRINVSETRGNSPGALAFHRDMHHNVPLQELTSPTSNTASKSRLTKTYCKLMHITTVTITVSANAL